MDPNTDTLFPVVILGISILVPLLVMGLIVGAVVYLVVRGIGVQRGAKSWKVTVEPALLMPGSGGAVSARFAPAKPVQHDGIRVSLTCVEEYVYETTESDSDGGTRTVRHTGTEHLHEQTYELAPAGTIGPEGAEWRFGLEIPALAAPSYEGETLRVTWKVRVFANVNGPDIAREIVVPVGAPVERLSAGVIDLEEGAPRLEYALADGTIAVDALPFDLTRSGAATIAIPPAPPEARAIRVELMSGANVRVGGVDSMKVAWGTTLAPTALASGTLQVPLAGPFVALPDMDTPHGRARGWLVVTYDIPNRPDQVRRRPIALARGTMDGPVRWDSAPMG